MSSFIRTILSPKPHSLFEPQTIAHRSFSLTLIFGAIWSTRPETPIAKPELKSEPDPKPRKPLDILFKEAVGIYPKPENCNNNGGKEIEENPVKRGLSELEKEIRVLRSKKSVNSDENRPEPLFTNRVRRNGQRIAAKSFENPMTFREIMGDAKLFVSHLHREGYLNDANFLSKDKDGVVSLDFGSFDNSFSRGFLKFAAEKFGEDKQEIAKWLPGSDLKTVALFGCPSLSRRSVFAAKRMRNFFKIAEDTVCSKCALKSSCKFVNKNVWDNTTKNLALLDVLSVVTLYALESLPPDLVVPDEVKASVSRILNDVIKLSQTAS